MPGLEWFVNIKSSPSSLSSTPRWSSSLPSAPLQVTTICTTTRHGQILLMVHHAITFVLGLLYVYFWMMARSLFLMVSTSWIRDYKKNICQHPSIVVYSNIHPLLVGPGGVRKGEGGEQDFHRQRASGTKTREHSVDCRNDSQMYGEKSCLVDHEWVTFVWILCF